MNSGKSLGPTQQKRILKELRRLHRQPLEDIRLHASEESIEHIRATIVGPNDTPFENGEFQLRLEFGSDFPNEPPKGYFITRIFHPNVDPQSGAICVNTLKRDWDPNYGLQHILVAIRSLLIVPNADSALNEEAGKLLLDSYEEFARRAKIFTKIHALTSLRRNDSQSSIECDENEERSSNLSPHNESHSHSKRRKKHRHRHKNETESKTGDDDVDNVNSDGNAEEIPSTTTTATVSSSSSKKHSHHSKHTSSSSLSSKKKHKKKHSHHKQHSSNSKVKASLRRL